MKEEIANKGPYLETGFCYNYYTVGKANAYFDKNMLLLKNPQYLPDHYETLTQ